MSKKDCNICDAIEKAEEVKFKGEDIICFRHKGKTIVVTEQHESNFNEDQIDFINDRIAEFWPGKKFVVHVNKCKHANGVIV